MIKPASNILPFGSGYLNYLHFTATRDEEEPASPRIAQPIRYLGPVEPMVEESRMHSWQESSTSVSQVIGQSLNAAIAYGAGAPSLREAVIALRQKILIS